jgi:hypothetical protein
MSAAFMELLVGDLIVGDALVRPTAALSASNAADYVI